MSDPPCQAGTVPQSRIRRYDLTLSALAKPAKLKNAYPPAAHCLLVAQPDERTRTLAAKLVDEGWKITWLAEPQYQDKPIHPDARFVAIDQIQLTSVEAALSSVDRVVLVLHILPITEDDSLTPQSASLDQLRLAFLLAKFNKQPLSALSKNARAAFVTVASLDGQWGMQGARVGSLAAGAIPGLLKTLSMESPDVFCRAIDLDPDYSPEQWSQRLLDEIHAADHGIVEVAWKGSERYGLTLSTELPSQVVDPMTDTVHVISGGARGITAKCIEALARRHRGGRYLLLGRTDITSPEPEWALGLSENALKQAAIAALKNIHQKITPKLIDRALNDIKSAREVRNVIERLKPLCQAVDYVSIDITQQADVHKLMAHPMLQGDESIALIHGAGSLSDRLIENKSLDDFERVFSAKVYGLDNLLKTIPSSRIARLWLFSSVAGLFGNIGQADYAMANELLNRIAARHLSLYRVCHVMSFNWGAWDAGMVTPQVKEIFEARNIPLISIEEGMDLFASSASSAPPPHGVFLAGAPTPLSPELRTIEAIHEPVEMTMDLTMLKDSSLIADHQIGDSIVWPLSFALGSAIHQLEAYFNGFDVEYVGSFRVLNGLLVDDAMPPSIHLRIQHSDHHRLDNNASVDVTLLTDGTRQRYQGHAIRLRHRSSPHHTSSTVVQSMTDAEDAQRLYASGVLFHRRGFQFLKQYKRLADGDLLCRFAFEPPTEHGLMVSHRGRRYCPLLFDAMLQAALCLVRQTEGEASLPMEIRNLRTKGRPEYDESPVYVLAHKLTSSVHESVVSLLATDRDGKLLASTEACVVKSQALAAKFQQNEFSEAE